MIRLLQNRQENFHVSQDTVIEFENIISNDPQVQTLSTPHKYFVKINYRIWRYFNRTPFNGGRLLKYLPWNFLNKNSNDCFSILMGTDFHKGVSSFIHGNKKHVYMFDAWPKDHKAISEFINSFQINTVFLSSFDACKQLSESNRGCEFHWIPEAINPDEYKHKPSAQKTIDVVQLGRKYDSYHALIQPPLEANNKIYLFEKEKGTIIFPHRKDFIEGLANSKISICFPSSTTHPERAGDIETMTVRYLQSMASKCLIVGQAPKEMIRLFNYNPVIEFDKTNPAEQLLNLLNTYDEYLPLIEKNHKMVITNHTWSNRWDQIANTILNPS